jgi:hypothetical protein
MKLRHKISSECNRGSKSRSASNHLKSVKLGLNGNLLPLKASRQTETIYINHKIDPLSCC